MDYPLSKPRSVRSQLTLAALGYLAFVIYGSLVPLAYVPMPIDEAIASFHRIPFLRLGIGSRADWVANALLFIPLTFLWLGLIWPRKRGITRLLASLLILVAAVLLSLGIEFTQLFFPQRTVSQNDILAETIGALIGIALWWWYGQRLTHWIAVAWETRGQTGIAEKLLWLYLAGLFIYNILPLDLTISPVEIYHKWRSGKVSLIPFSFKVEGTAQYLYNLVTDALLWVPVSLLCVLSSRRRGMQAWAWTVLIAIFLEFCQFFVFSRVSDTTDILMAMIGAGAGIWIAGLFPENKRSSHRAQRSNRTTQSTAVRPILALIAGGVWTLVLMAVFWYPFEFEFDRSLLRERLELFLRAPLTAYYYGTEFRAVTELLHKILFFIPLGATLALGRLGLPPSPGRIVYSLITACILLAVPFGIELGQVALPDKNPDITDLILEVIGGVIGYYGLPMLTSRVEPPSPTEKPNLH
ncbi:MAG: VanZ family protein [Gammaproteobacteria bacterium]|nr:VanZ family protein [Gammaproteobacteria bacterium]